MAIVSGLVCIAAGVARLGFVTELLSKPIRYGYMNGIALTVLLSQLPKLLGFSVDGDGPLRQALGDRREGVLDGRRTGGARRRRRNPRGHPAAQARPNACRASWSRSSAATVAVACSIWRQRPASTVLGAAAGPAGSRLPLDRRRPTSRPSSSAAVAVALVAFADTSVLSRTYAARTAHATSIRTRRWSASGVANLAAGFFQGFPISSSSSRTPVAEAAGAKTQLTGVVGALAIALLLLVAPDLLRNLPTPRWPRW